MMMAEYEGRRVQQKKHGPTYRCGHCTLTFPAEAFDVDRNDIADLHTMCVGLGSLRVCSACVQMPAGTSTSLCSRCRKQRQLGYFCGESDICSACQLQDKYPTCRCCVHRVHSEVDVPAGICTQAEHTRKEPKPTHILCKSAMSFLSTLKASAGNVRVQCPQR